MFLSFFQSIHGRHGVTNIETGEGPGKYFAGLLIGT
jgi:hypothetical protein